MAIPAGLIMNRFGYKKGIIFGLLTYAAGAFLFMPAAQIQTFEFTLFCLFVIACGLTCLETAANPFSTVLGPKETSEQRLNLSQSFNGLGWIMGPAIGGLLILGGDGKDPNKFASMTLPYMIIGTLVLLVAILFMITRLPEIHEGEFDAHGDKGKYRDLLKYPHFKYAVVSQFLYVAAQTGINSFFINYVTETMPQFSNEKAAYLLSIGFIFFMVGRFSGSVMMTWFKPNQMLALYASINVLAMVFVIMGLGWLSSDCNIFYIFLYVDYVSDNLCPGNQRPWRTYKERIILPGDDGCRWRCLPYVHGLDRRYLQDGNRIHCSPGMFCIYNLFRSSGI